MARLARVVVPGLPHHITQRGNRRQPTFFCDDDYQYYVELMGQWCTAHQVEIWAYCLMPNHVHLIAVPQSTDGLRRAIGEVHRRYTRMVNFLIEPDVVVLVPDAVLSELAGLGSGDPAAAAVRSTPWIHVVPTPHFRLCSTVETWSGRDGRTGSSPGGNRTGRGSRARRLEGEALR